VSVRDAKLVCYFDRIENHNIISRIAIRGQSLLATATVKSHSLRIFHDRWLPKKISRKLS